MAYKGYTKLKTTDIWTGTENSLNQDLPDFWISGSMRKQNCLIV